MELQKEFRNCLPFEITAYNVPQWITLKSFPNPKGKHKHTKKETAKVREREREREENKLAYKLLQLYLIKCKFWSSCDCRGPSRRSIDLFQAKVKPATATPTPATATAACHTLYYKATADRHRTQLTVVILLLTAPLCLPYGAVNCPSKDYVVIYKISRRQPATTTTITRRTI